MAVDADIVVEDTIVIVVDTIINYVGAVADVAVDAVIVTVDC